jgi:hypothetical protein
MQFPEAFNNLLRQFHLEFFRDRTPEEAITSALMGIGRRQCAEIAHFLDDLMSKPYDVDQVMRLMWESPADIAPTDASQIPHILRLIRELIDSPRVQSTPLP